MMKGNKKRLFQGAPKADPYWPRSHMSQAWIKGNTAERGGEIICWIYKIIEVSFSDNQRCLIVTKSYENKGHNSGQRLLRVRKEREKESEVVDRFNGENLHGGLHRVKAAWGSSYSRVSAAIITIIMEKQLDLFDVWFGVGRTVA